jgi:hypothetical protein
LSDPSRYPNKSRAIPNIVAYWRLGEHAGTVTAVDELVTHPGTIAGGVAPAIGALDGDTNGAMSFDGASGTGIQVSNAPAPTSQITLSAWIKTTPGGDNNQRVIDRSNTTVTAPFSDYALEVRSGTGLLKGALEMDIGGVGYFLNTTSDITDNVWHHLVGTYDGSNLNVYLDGLPDGSMPATGSITDRGMPMYLGRYGADPTIVRYGGVMDEVAVYDRALTPAEVQALYLAGTDGRLVRGVVNQSRTITDSITSSESLSRTSSRTRSITDSATFSESNTATAGKTRTATDALTFIDVGTRGARTSTRAITDALTFTEALTRISTYPRSPTDALTFTESLTRTALTFIRALTDHITFSDAAANASGGGPRTGTDSLTFADVATRAAMSRTGTATDALTFTDTVVRTRAISRAVTDAVTLAEVLTRTSLAYARTGTDALSLADAVTRISNLVLRSVTDALTFTERRMCRRS